MPKKTIMLIGAVVVVFVVGFFPADVSADESSATTAISNAKSQITSCYEIARDAEVAGANITTLAAVLNDAGLLLSHSEFAFSSGDFAGAQDYAVQSQARLADFTSKANALAIAAASSGNQDFLISVVCPTIGVSAVLIASVGLWFYLKRKYALGGEQAEFAAT